MVCGVFSQGTPLIKGQKKVTVHLCLVSLSGCKTVLAENEVLIYFHTASNYFQESYFDLAQSEALHNLRKNMTCKFAESHLISSYKIFSIRLLNDLYQPTVHNHLSDCLSGINRLTETKKIKSISYHTTHIEHTILRG